MGEGLEDSGSQAPAPPTMYRWISTTKGPVVADCTKSKRSAEATAGQQASDEPRMILTFSVPIAALPPSVDDTASREPATVPPIQSKHCDYEGCNALRKYRLVKDWQRGACGMTHLKALEAQLTNTA